MTERFSRLAALRVTVPPAEIYHSYYKYYVFVRPERLKRGWDRDRIILEITKSRIPCFSGSCSEVYMEKAFAERDLMPAERLPVARELGETRLMFLVHPTLRQEYMHKVADVVERVLESACK